MTPDVVFIDYKDIVAFRTIIILIFVLVGIFAITGIVMLIKFIHDKIKQRLKMKRKGSDKDDNSRID